MYLKLTVLSRPVTEGRTQTFILTQEKEARKEREAQIAKVQMEAALSNGVGWGMDEDAQVNHLRQHHPLLSTVALHNHVSWAAPSSIALI